MPAGRPRSAYDADCEVFERILDALAGPGAARPHPPSALAPSCIAQEMFVATVQQCPTKKSYPPVREVTVRMIFLVSAGEERLIGFAALRAPVCPPAGPRSLRREEGRRRSR